MILNVGVVNNPEEVGFYSGIIESVFSCTSFIASESSIRFKNYVSLINVIQVMPCAFISNRFGRKPVLLLSSFGLAVSTVMFATSRSFPLMVVTRCIGGMLGGGSVFVNSVL